MSNGAKVAMAVAAGYLLGRTKKGRLALMLAGAGLTGKFPTHPSDLVAHGLKSLGTSNQVADLAEQLRGEVLNAAKAAALAAATNRVDALNDRIQGIAAPATETVKGATDTVDRASEPIRSVAGLRRARPSNEQEDYDELGADEYADEEEPSERDDYEDADIVDEDELEEEAVDEPDEEPDEEPEEEPDDEPQPRARRRASRQATTRTTRRRSSRTSSDDAATPAARTRRRASAATKRAPVRRGR